jgi:2-phospho-L-lactate transferase/gluconeogenesis factor (CofD/UPF0052 family)
MSGDGFSEIEISYDQLQEIVLLKTKHLTEVDSEVYGDERKLIKRMREEDKIERFAEAYNQKILDKAHLDTLTILSQQTKDRIMREYATSELVDLQDRKRRKKNDSSQLFKSKYESSCVQLDFD